MQAGISFTAIISIVCTIYLWGAYNVIKLRALSKLKKQVVQSNSLFYHMQ